MECRVRGVQSSRSAEFAEPAEIGRVKSGMVAEDGDVEVGRLGENQYAAVPDLNKVDHRGIERSLM